MLSGYLLIENLLVDWKTRAPQSLFMNSSSPSTTVSTAPWNSLLPLLLASPDIYNVPFEGSFSGSRPQPCTSTQIDEILIWKYMKPLGSLHQDQCERDLRSIDIFLDKSTPEMSHDPPCPLTTYHRGWNETVMGLSCTLISLFSWRSEEAESRFKNPLESSLSYEWYTEADLYEKSFLGMVENMKQNEWISQERQVHLRLDFWRPPKVLA